MSGLFIIAPTPTLRAGLRAMLPDSSRDIVGEASSIEQDDHALADIDANVFILTDPSQLARLAGVLADDRSQSVVLLTNDVQTVNALRALPLRGWSIVPSDASAEELRAAVIAATQGLVALPRDMAGQLLDARAAIEPAAQPDVVELEQPLTPREVEVLELVSRGLPSKLIAKELDVSESTVKFHLSSIYTKLDVASRTEAVSRAAKLGLITL